MWSAPWITEGQTSPHHMTLLSIRWLHWMFNNRPGQRKGICIYKSSILTSRTARDLIIPRVFTCLRPVLALTFDDKIQVLWTILIYRRKNVWCFFFYLYVCKYSWKIVLTSFMTVKSRQSDMSFGRVNNK